MHYQSPRYVVTPSVTPIWIALENTGFFYCLVMKGSPVQVRLGAGIKRPRKTADFQGFARFFLFLRKTYVPNIYRNFMPFSAF